MSSFPLETITPLRHELARHPIYAAVQTRGDLTQFMQHHVYSVWDFMSLVKYLQHYLAPAAFPWLPGVDPQVQRFINDIVLEEESDEGLPLDDGSATYISHFELYTLAMEEVQPRSSEGIQSFIQEVKSGPLEIALQHNSIPTPARAFMETTFGFLESGKPHVVAAAFALGREHIIPDMFRALLKAMQISRDEAKVFHYYLDRHIHLDGDFHGPMSLRMLELLCEGDGVKIAEAEAAAIAAIQGRITFWDGVLDALNC